MQKLFVSIDPGFDSLKVVAGGKTFKIPFSVQETDERKLTDYRIRNDFILYREPSGATYRVGSYARELIYENKNQQNLDSQMNIFYSESRFTSAEFLVGLRVALALALECCNINPNENPEIYLMVALPHAVRQKYAAAVVGNCAGHHKFSMVHGTKPEVNYEFVILENHVFTVSQTIAAIIGETSDDNGNINDDRFFYLTNGPTLVLDGGYYTMGLVSVSKGGSVDDSMTESDTNHAMKNVNIAIANAIKEHRPDVKHFQMEYLIQNEGKIRYMHEGKAATIDLVQLREEKIQEVCSSLIEHLNEKYNNLLDFNYVLVAGGTGAAFYQQLFDYYTSTGISDADHFLLASSELMGQKYSIEYSIAIGAYKGLMGVADRAN